MKNTMNERVLCKSQRYHPGKILIVLLVILVVVCLSINISWYSDAIKDYNDRDSSYCWCGDYNIYGRPMGTCYMHEFSSAEAYAFDDSLTVVFLTIIGGAFLLFGIVYFGLFKHEMTVTDKRVYGVAAFGKRVDLPLDSISTISFVPWLKGVMVSTSSGKVRFVAIKNAEQIMTEVNKLIIQRQKPIVQSTSAPTSKDVNMADELKRFKELFDAGIITQEEYEAKRKQIIGL